MSMLDALPRLATKAQPKAAELARATSAPVRTSGRDPRIDMFRGLALLMVYIDHVPGTAYEYFTSRNFGFSDAAEAFVLMSGLAAGLAYSGRFRAAFWPATFKVWARARTLYLTHIAVLAICLAMFAAAALWFDAPAMLHNNGVNLLFSRPLESLVGIPTLLYQPGYLNILPLYALLLLATPAIMPLILRWPWAALAVSVGIWAIAGELRLNFPTLPAAGGWFLDPLSWQLIFVIGLLGGTGMKLRQPFVPYMPSLFWGAAAFLVFIVAWVRIDALGAAGRDVLAALDHAGVPGFITWFDKPSLAFPRLLHALALAYVLACLPSVRSIAGSRYAAPFRLLGQHGLPVFALATILSLLFQTIKTTRDPDPVVDGLLLGGGFALLLAFAYVLSRIARIRRSASPTNTNDASQEAPTW